MLERSDLTGLEGFWTSRRDEIRLLNKIKEKLKKCLYDVEDYKKLGLSKGDFEHTIGIRHEDLETIQFILEEYKNQTEHLLKLFDTIHITTQVENSMVRKTRYLNESVERIAVSAVERIAVFAKGADSIPFNKEVLTSNRVDLLGFCTKEILENIIKNDHSTDFNSAENKKERESHIKNLLSEIYRISTQIFRNLIESQLSQKKYLDISIISYQSHKDILQTILQIIEKSKEISSIVFKPEVEKSEEIENILYGISSLGSELKTIMKDDSERSKKTFSKKKKLETYLKFDALSLKKLKKETLLSSRCDVLKHLSDNLLKRYNLVGYEYNSQIYSNITEEEKSHINNVVEMAKELVREYIKDHCPMFDSDKSFHSVILAIIQNSQIINNFRNITNNEIMIDFNDDIWNLQKKIIEALSLKNSKKETLLSSRCDVLKHLSDNLLKRYNLVGYEYNPQIYSNITEEEKSHINNVVEMAKELVREYIKDHCPMFDSDKFREGSCDDSLRESDSILHSVILAIIQNSQIINNFRNITNNEILIDFNDDIWNLQKKIIEIENKNTKNPKDILLSTCISQRSKPYSELHHRLKELAEVESEDYFNYKDRPIIDKITIESHIYRTFLELENDLKMKYRNYSSMPKNEKTLYENNVINAINYSKRILNSNFSDIRLPTKEVTPIFNSLKEVITDLNSAGYYLDLLPSCYKHKKELIEFNSRIQSYLQSAIDNIENETFNIQEEKTEENSTTISKIIFHLGKILQRPESMIAESFREQTFPSTLTNFYNRTETHYRSLIKALDNSFGPNHILKETKELILENMKIQENNNKIVKTIYESLYRSLKRVRSFSENLYSDSKLDFDLNDIQTFENDLQKVQQNIQSHEKQKKCLEENLIERKVIESTFIKQFNTQTIIKEITMTKAMLLLLSSNEKNPKTQTTSASASSQIPKNSSPEL